MPSSGVALVTGAAGFIGANLVRRLIEDGVTVHAIVRPGTDRWRLSDLLTSDGLVIHDIDLTDQPAVRHALDRSKPHVVFHLARHRGDPARLDYDEAFRHNVDATRNLLQAACGLAAERFIHVGSSLEYDLKRSPQRETDAPAPATIHGLSRAAASLLAQHFARVHRLPVVVLRLFSVYGPWDQAAHFVPSVIRAALADDTIRLTDDECVHDWTYVDDVVDALLHAARCDAGGIVGEIFNVATGRSTANEEVVALAGEIVGRPIRPDADQLPSRPWDCGSWVADVSKARDLLGWQARTDLRAGLQQTLAWLRR